MNIFDLQQQDFFKVLGSTSRSQVAILNLEPGQSTGGPNNLHRESDQWLYVIAGSGEATVAGEVVKLEAGELLLIEAGEPHEIRNPSSKALHTFSIYAPVEY